MMRKADRNCLWAPGVGVALMLSGPMAMAADIRLESSVNTQVGLTNNGEGSSADSGGNAQAILDGQYHTAIRAKGARASAALDYTLGLTKSIGGSDDFQVNNDLLAVGTAELLRDLMYIDLQGTTNRQMLQPNGRITSQRQVTGQSDAFTSPVINDSNSTQVTLLDISPYLTRDFGTLAQGEARYRFRQGFVGSASIGNPQGHLGRLLVRTGSTISEPALTALLEVENISDSSGSSVTSTDGSPQSPHLTRWTGEVTAQYPLMRGLFALATLGYERITADSLADEINGPFGMAGIRFAPSPRTEAQILIGERYDRLNISALLSYAITPNLRIRLDYEDYLGTVFDNIAAIPLAVDVKTGEFINRDTGRRARQEAVALGLSSEINIGHRFRASLAGQYDIQTIQLTGVYEKREYDFSPDLSEWRLTLDYRRTMSQSLTGLLSFTFVSNHTEDAGSAARTMLASAGLSYAITDSTSAQVIYTFSRDLGGASGGRESSHYIGVGLGYRF